VIVWVQVVDAYLVAIPYLGSFNPEYRQRVTWRS
jgi:hypothetical protein